MCSFEIVTNNRYTVDIRQEQMGDVLLCHFAFSFAEVCSPSLLDICWTENDRQYYAAYDPSKGGTHSLSPNWAPCHVGSAMCQNMPFMALLGRCGECLYTATLSDVTTPAELAYGYIEETDRTFARVRLFTAPSHPMKDYKITLRIDKRKTDVYTACQAAVAWWRSLGYGNDDLPDSAFEPVYSTWYGFHQRLDEEELLAECTIAASLGMKTLIIDDGWQSEDNNRGYAYCGDWKMAESKFKSFPDFVERIHALGMKVMLWYAVPFVGDLAEMYDRFKGKYLNHVPGARTNVLDPRYKDVRDYLTDIYANALRDYGIDGFKLDFIDSFHNYGSFVHNEEMDCYSVEDGAAKLLEEIKNKLQAIKKDVLIEFRQAYYGPVIGKYANMLRVGDCPGDIHCNLNETVRMRCLTDGTAIHSDMLTYHENETVEGFLSQFFAAFFAVPQFSFKLAKLSREKKQALGFYLTFHNDHRELIFKGDLRPCGVEKGVLKVESRKNGEALILLYRDRTVYLDESERIYLINACGEDGAIVCARRNCSYSIRNYFGDTVASGKIEKGHLTELPIKDAYLCEFAVDR